VSCVPCRRSVTTRPSSPFTTRDSATGTPS
jgi:hypothetical protein